MTLKDLKRKSLRKISKKINLLISKNQKNIIADSRQKKLNFQTRLQGFDNNKCCYILCKKTNNNKKKCKYDHVTS